MKAVIRRYQHLKTGGQGSVHTRRQAADDALFANGNTQKQYEAQSATHWSANQLCSAAVTPPFLTVQDQTLALFWSVLCVGNQSILGHVLWCAPETRAASTVRERRMHKPIQVVSNERAPVSFKKTQLSNHPQGGHLRVPNDARHWEHTGCTCVCDRWIVRQNKLFR